MLHLQVVTNFSEVSQLHPARLDATASRDAMTLTRLPHGGLNCLRESENNKEFSTFLIRRTVMTLV